jgi:hypothetical protein
MRDSITPFVLAVALTGTLTLGTQPTNAQYKQKNLVSNAEGHAIHTDPNLINGWGLAFFLMVHSGLRTMAPEYPPFTDAMANRTPWW